MKIYTFTLMVLSILTFSSCSKSESEEKDDVVVEETTASKSAREKLAGMKSINVIDNVSKQIDELESKLNNVQLVVHYDADGMIWLSGRGALNHTRKGSLDDLSIQLSKVILKGDVVIKYTGYKANRDIELEAMIMDLLRKNEFTVVTNEY